MDAIVESMCLALIDWKQWPNLVRPDVLAVFSHTFFFLLFFHASLSKPFQRLLKYPLLFQNLLFHTDPSTYEYESTLQMVAEVETIVRSIEDEKIHKEERDKTRQSRKSRKAHIPFSFQKDARAWASRISEPSSEYCERGGLTRLTERRKTLINEMWR